MLRPQGMVLEEFKNYINAFAQAKLNPQHGKRPDGSKGSRIMQIVGSAGPSAGTHAADGTFKNEKGKFEEYTGAIDIRTTDLSKSEILTLVRALLNNGFMVWWRNSGSFLNNQHIHAIYVGVKLKKSLRKQVLSGLNRRNALVSNTVDPILKTVEQSTLDALQKEFLKNNKSFSANPDEDVITDEEEICGCEHVDTNGYGVEF